MRRWRLVWLGAILALGALGAALPPHGFFVGDSGAKYLQAHAIAENADWPKIIRYPGVALDPQRRLVAWDLVPRGAGLTAVYPFLFALVTALPIWLAGDRLLLLPAAIGGLVAASCAAGLARRLAAEHRACQHPAVFLLATPLAFYSLVVWEHSVAAATMLAAVLLLVKPEEGEGSPGRWFGGGLLFGTALWLRTEMIFMLPLLALPLVQRTATRLRSTGIVLAGAAGGLTAGLLLQRLVIGEWAPIHVIASAALHAGRLGRVEARLATLHALYLPDPWLALALAALLAALALTPILGSRRATLATVAGAASMGVGLLAVFLAPAVRLLSGAKPTLALPFSAALPAWVVLTALPVMLAPTGDRRPLGRVRALIGFTVVAAVIGELVALPMFGEYQWGPRYLLTPLLLLVALEVSAGGARSSGNAGRRTAIGVAIAAGVILQCLGLGLLRHAARGNADLVTKLLDATGEHEVVASDCYALTQLTTPAWPRRTLLLIATPQDWPYFLAGLDRTATAAWWWAELEGFNQPAPAAPDLRSPRGSRWVRGSEQRLHAGGRELRLFRYGLIREAPGVGGEPDAAAKTPPASAGGLRAETLVGPAR
jgi:hypothetical protein